VCSSDLLLKAAEYLIAKNYSPRTIRNYTSEMRYIFSFYNEKGPTQIDQDDIIRYLNFIKAQFGSGYDKCRMVAQSCSFFYKNILRVDYVVPSAFYPRKEFKLPNILAKKEVQHLLKSTTNFKHKCLLAMFCGTLKKDQWVENRVADLLPTPYYHIVFTVPHSWNKVMMQSPKEMYKILFAAASQTLLTLGENPEFLGATPGITAVLHIPPCGTGYGGRHSHIIPIFI